MELKMPTPEQAYWGLRAMKTVALADGALDEAEQQMLTSIQTILGTNHPVESLAAVTPAELASALADRQIRQLSKGMAQQVQILGCLVHEPRLVVFDEPFSGLDAINQGKLEKTMRGLADKGTTVIFSTHVIAHAERLCDGIAIIAGGKVPFAGPVDVARDRIPAQVRLETRAADGPWRAALPADARHDRKLDGTSFFYFPLPETGIEPLLRALIEGEAGILSLSIERAGLHDAFVAIAGEAAARALEENPEEEQRR